MKNFIKMIMSIIDKTVEYICMASLATMFILMFIQIAARYLFDSGSAMVDESIQHLFVWSIYFSMVLTAREKQHVVVTALVGRFKGKLKFCVLLFANLAWIYFNLFMVYSSIILIDDLLVFGAKTAALGIVQAYLYLVLPITFSWTSYYVVLDIIDLFKKEFGKKEELE